MLHTVRRRAVKELRRYGPGLVLGIASAQGAMTLMHDHALPIWAVVFLGCTGDNIGFYGFEWVREGWRLRHGPRGFWWTVGRSLWNTIKHYWLAELLDTLVFRAWMLALAAFLINDRGFATLTGNVLADVLFFGVVVTTGIDFSDWAISKIARLRPRPRSREPEPLYEEDPIQV